MRGPKFPHGVGIRKVLLIALDYPDGISEPYLIDKIQEKLSYTHRRGIKGHLGYLGPGITIKGEWKKGKQYLIKIPSKFELNAVKKRVVEILKSQGIEIDYNDLPEENFWKPNPKRIVELSKYILDGAQLDREDLQQLQQNDFILNFIAKKHSSLFEDNEALKELKMMLKVSPRMFELSLKIEDLGERFSSVHDFLSYHGFSDFIAQNMGDDRKRYIRWELFRSCIKTDTGFLEKEDYTFDGKLYEMLQIYDRKRTKSEDDYISSLIEKRS